jgi:hypothetical protein
MIKKLTPVFILLIAFSCNSSSRETKDISTVDSNVTEPVDSNPALLYLDNPNDSNFSIAIDSSVRPNAGNR